MIQQYIKFKTAISDWGLSAYWKRIQSFEDQRFSTMLSEYNKLIRIVSHPKNQNQHLRTCCRLIDQFYFKWYHVDSIGYFIDSLKTEYAEANYNIINSNCTY